MDERSDRGSYWFGLLKEHYDLQSPDDEAASINIALAIDREMPGGSELAHPDEVTLGTLVVGSFVLGARQGLFEPLLGTSPSQKASAVAKKAVQELQANNEDQFAFIGPSAVTSRLALLLETLVTS